MMPGLDGYEVARRIREHPQYGDVPIIMVTALTGKADRLLAVQAGANDFSLKWCPRRGNEANCTFQIEKYAHTAQTRESTGSEAAYRALCLKAGFFSTLAWAEPKRTTIDMPGQLLLIEAARKRDEENQPADDDP